MRYDDLAWFAEEHGFEWKRTDGTYFLPAADDLQATVDEMMKQLNESGLEDGQIETGGLIVQKRGSHFDLFVHFGEV